MAFCTQWVLWHSFRWPILSTRAQIWLNFNVFHRDRNIFHSVVRFANNFAFCWYLPLFEHYKHFLSICLQTMQRWIKMCMHGHSWVKISETVWLWDKHYNSLCGKLYSSNVRKKIIFKTLWLQCKWTFSCSKQVSVNKHSECKSSNWVSFWLKPFFEGGEEIFPKSLCVFSLLLNQYIWIYLALNREIQKTVLVDLRRARKTMLFTVFHLLLFLPCISSWGNILNIHKLYIKIPYVLIHRPCFCQ